MNLIIFIDENGKFLGYKFTQENFILKVDDYIDNNQILVVEKEDNHEFEISIVKITLRIGEK